MSKIETRSGNTLHGPMTWIASDQYIGPSLELYGQFSAGESSLFQHFVKPGSTALDIGANIGVFTVALSRCATPSGRVLAFEPQTGVFNILSTNVGQNFLNNVTLYQAGVGQESGTLNVPPLDYSAHGNFGGVELSEENEGPSVEIMTIDSLDLRACHFIKIDVEGMEIEAIAGGVKTIKNCRPTLFVENDRQHNSATLIKSIFDLEYRIYWHLSPLFEVDNFYRNSENIFGRLLSANMLCLPSEITQNITGLTEIQSPEDWFM